MDNNIITTPSNPEGLRVVNIIGRAPSGQNCPPYGENWCINHSWVYGNSCDKLFIMDGWQAMMDSAISNGTTKEAFVDFVVSNKEMEVYNAYNEKLTDTSGNVVCQAIAFPQGLTTQLIPGTFFNSSMAHMLAFAAIQEELGSLKCKELEAKISGIKDAKEIENLTLELNKVKKAHRKIDTINLYGIEVWGSFDRAEYKEQAPCLDFWIPFLYGKGIQVMIPAYILYVGRSQGNLYGYIR
jgi:hypothetical protein